MSPGLKEKKRLLFVAPPYFGHINQMIVLARELSDLGHQVGFASTELFRDRFKSTGIRFLRWEPEEAMTDAGLLKRRAGLWSAASRCSGILRGERQMLSVVADSYAAMYQTLTPIWRQLNPDLAVVDSAVVPAFDLARQHQVPYIIQLQFLGNHAGIGAGYPRYGTDYSIRMTPWQRVLNLLHPLRVSIYFAPAIARLNRARARCGALTPVRQLYTKSLMLVCSAYGIELPRPLPPLMKMVGPILPRQPDPLDASLGAWLAGGGSPVVYMSFGTLATLEAWQVQALVRGLNDPRWRVLWSLRPSQQEWVSAAPPTFHIQASVPQQAVLAHPAVRAFVSHCGMNSVSESLYWGKPILALPIFGDQHYNAARVADVGAGLRLRKQRFDSNEVRRKMESLLDGPGYTAAARKMSNVLRQTGGLDEAARIVEHTLASGFNHLIPEMLYATALTASPERAPASNLLNRTT
jgi:UDP:flavonoid glycosyltransferase YjiC (YdhE family)